MVSHQGGTMEKDPKNNYTPQMGRKVRYPLSY